MQNIELILKRCDLLEPNALKSLDIINKLEKFIQLSESQYLPNLKLDEQNNFVNTSIKLLQKQCSGSVEKGWIGVLFVDSLLNFC